MQRCLLGADGFSGWNSTVPWNTACPSSSPVFLDVSACLLLFAAKEGCLTLRGLMAYGWQGALLGSVVLYGLLVEYSCVLLLGVCLAGFKLDCGMRHARLYQKFRYTSGHLWAFLCQADPATHCNMLQGNASCDPGWHRMVWIHWVHAVLCSLACTLNATKTSSAIGPCCWPAAQWKHPSCSHLSPPYHLSLPCIKFTSFLHVCFYLTQFLPCICTCT